MSFPRPSARTVDTPSPRRRRWWGTSVALALVLAGCAAPPGGRGDGGRAVGLLGRPGVVGGFVLGGRVVERGLAVGRRRPRGPRAPPGNPLP